MRPGRYTNPEQINRILQGHFQFYDDLLKQMLPQLASRHFMEFILHQYDQSCEIDGLFKKGKLSADDMEFWRETGPRWRRATEVSGRMQLLAGSRGRRLRRVKRRYWIFIDRAVIYAESLVYLSTLSDQTYMIFPDRTELTISAEGEFEYLNLKVNPEVGEEFQKRGSRAICKFVGNIFRWITHYLIGPYVERNSTKGFPKRWDLPMVKHSA